MENVTTLWGSARWILERTKARAATEVWQTARFSVPLYRFAEHLKAAVAKGLEDHDLLPAEFEVLQSLYLAGPDTALKPSDLYRALLMSSGGITKLLKSLTARGLIDIRPDPADRRQKAVKLSETGRARFAAALEDVIAAEHAIISAAFPEEMGDQAAIAALLAQAINRVECS